MKTITINLDEIQPEDARNSLMTIIDCFKKNALTEEERCQMVTTCVLAALRKNLRGTK